MNAVRAFRLLGKVPSALQVTGSTTKYALSSRAQIIATNKDKTDTVVSRLSTTTLSIVPGREDAKEWNIFKEYVFAREDGNLVLAVPRGAYRVDIGYGANFTCPPSNIIGTLGRASSKVVYTHGRFDSVLAWLKASWALLSRALRGSWFTVTRWASRIPLPERVRNVELPRLRIPPQVKDAWSKTRDVLSRTYRSASSYTFHATHPPRLRIEGPCSILMKP